MAGDPDDLFDVDHPIDGDDPIDGERARIEERFRELERDEELRRMRGGRPPKPATERAAPGEDDLAGMKEALERDAEDADEAHDADDAEERYVLLLCPSCASKNRTSLTRVRHSLPRCGACKKPLWFA